MNSVQAIIDGNTVKFLEPISVKGKYKATVIFHDPLEEKEEARQKFLKFFGTGDDADVKLMQEMIDDRVNSLIRGMK